MRKSDGRLRRLGDQIRARRIAANLTQDQLGQRAGIVGKYVSEIERGTRDMPFSTLTALVEQGLGLQLEVVFSTPSSAKSESGPPLPPTIEAVARKLAALDTAEHGRVVAIVHAIVELVES